MPVSEDDIWRSARLMIKQHGESAWEEAVMKYFEMKRRGDQEGMETWRRIVRVIDVPTDKPS